MPWGGRTWLKLIQEGVGGVNYGVLNASPTAGQVIYPTLQGDNNFTPRVTPAVQQIRTADSGNRRKFSVSGFKGSRGVLNTVLHPDQAAFWVEALTSLTNDAGGRPCLPSYSAEFWDSTQAWRLLGGRAENMTITSTADQDWVGVSIGWIFKKRDPAFTTFAEPASTVYSSLIPYQHVETAGNILKSAVAVTKYRTVEVRIKNILDGTRDEESTITDLYYCGRDFDWSFGPQYIDNTYRAAWEAQTMLTFALGWVRTSPAHSLIFDCKARSSVNSVDDNLPLGAAAYETVDVQVFLDGAAGADFTAAVS
jgi:hypothetical protein